MAETDAIVMELQDQAFSIKIPYIGFRPPTCSMHALNNASISIPHSLFFYLPVI